MLCSKDTVLDLSAVDWKQSYEKAEYKVADRPVEPESPSADQVSDYVSDTGSNCSRQRAEHSGYDNDNDHGCGKGSIGKYLNSAKYH